MRELILQRLAAILAGQTVKQMRWVRVGEFVYTDDLLNNPASKVGKKEFQSLDLGSIDYSVLPDEKLLHLFEMVLIQYSKQM